MSKAARFLGEYWKIVLILGVLTFTIGLYLQHGIHLGLDLMGGSHLVVRVQSEDAVMAEAGQVVDALVAGLTDKDLAYQEVFRTDDAQVKVLAPEPARKEELEQLVKEQFGRDWSWDWIAGEKPVFVGTMSSTAQRDIKDGAIRKALEIVRRRIDEYGVAEPTIQRQGLGSDRIALQLPGVEEPERVKNIISQAAYLEWRLVALPDATYAPDWRPGRTPEEALGIYRGNVPPDVEVIPGAPIGSRAPGVEQEDFYYPVKRTPVITGNELTNARRGQDQFGAPAVDFQLNARGAQKFTPFTRDHIDDLLAIVLDRYIISAPRIATQIPASGQITGSFTAQEAEDLALSLRAGALPAGIEILEERSVGPTLGADSIKKGVAAASIGMILVVAFMLYWYKLAGVNAVVALLMNLVIVIGVMAGFGATLTLPGIAGLILTIGMAVDANVLIFERIKEELRIGKTVRAAIQGGFQKAFSTIMDANITTLIAAAFLFQFGTGPIRGFAVTLSVGILASLFTAIFVSRVIFDQIYGRRQVERLSI